MGHMGSFLELASMGRHLGHGRHRQLLRDLAVGRAGQLSDDTLCVLGHGRNIGVHEESACHCTQGPIDPQWQEPRGSQHRRRQSGSRGGLAHGVGKGAARGRWIASR